MKNNLNYYEVLEINETASDEVIKAAYRALAKKYHPDSYQGNDDERKKNMAIINIAFETLSDPHKRKKYDESIHNKSDTDYTYTKPTAQEETSDINNKSRQEDEFFYDVSDDISDDKSSAFGKKVGKFFNAVGKEILGEMQKNYRMIENAYLDGINMDEYLLVRKFKQSKGYSRVGYAKAMEEKGLLRKNPDGKYEPTPLLRYYL